MGECQLMAIVSFAHRFVFVKTRKTAGTSIQDTLLPLCAPGDILTQVWTNRVDGKPCVIEEFASLDEIRRHFQVPSHGWFSFGFTRNPYALTLSRYFYQIKMKRISGPPSPEHFNAWVRTVYFVGEPGFPHGRYVKDRSRWLLFDRNFRPIVDFIGRMETIDADFAQVCTRIGLPPLPLTRSNQSNTSQIHYRDWMDNTTRLLVSKAFDFEIAAFSYRY